MIKALKRIGKEIVHLPFLLFFIIITPIWLLDVSFQNKRFRENDRNIRQALEKCDSLKLLLRYGEKFQIKFGIESSKIPPDCIQWSVRYPETLISSDFTFCEKYMSWLSGWDEASLSNRILVDIRKRKLLPDSEDQLSFVLAHEIGHIENHISGLESPCPMWKRHRDCLKNEILASLKAVDILIELNYIFDMNELIQERFMKESLRCWQCIKNPSCQSQFDNLSEIKMKHFIIQRDWRQYFDAWTIQVKN